MVRGPEFPAPIITKTVATVVSSSPPQPQSDDRVLLSKHSVMSSTSIEASTELEADDSYQTVPFASEEYGEENENDGNTQIADENEREGMKLRSSITLEEFELGMSPPEALLTEEASGSFTRTTRSLSHSDEVASHSGNIVNLLALASNPVLPDYSQDDCCSDYQPDAERSDDGDSMNERSRRADSLTSSPHAGAFSSFQRSFQDKFGATGGKSDKFLQRTTSNASQTSVSSSIDKVRDCLKVSSHPRISIPVS